MQNAPRPDRRRMRPAKWGRSWRHGASEPSGMDGAAWQHDSLLKLQTQLASKSTVKSRLNLVVCVCVLGQPGDAGDPRSHPTGCWP